jgi:ABC-type molybdate transport system substrate-binding protein
MTAMRRWLLIVPCLACAGPAAAWNSPAPDVVLYCPPALEAGLREVAASFTATSHVAVHLFVAPPDGLRGLVTHRARADVLVADADSVAALMGAGLVRQGSVVTLGQDGFALIGKAGAMAAGDAAQLVTSHATVLPDPTSAASFDGAAILHAALPGVSQPREIGVSDTPAVTAAVRGDGRLIGLVHRTEADGPGLVRAAALSAPATVMEGALVTNGQSANAGKLLDFIAGSEGKAMLRQSGLETAP